MLFLSTRGKCEDYMHKAITLETEISLITGCNVALMEGMVK
jgi:hypothetical protein